MIRILLGISLLLMLLALSPGQTRHPGGVTEATLVREIVEVKRQYDVAQLANHGKWFEKMLAEDYVFIGSNGAVSSKADCVKDMQSRDLVWDSVAVKDMKVRVYGDTAVVTGRFFGKGRYKGNRYRRKAALHVSVDKTEWHLAGNFGARFHESIRPMIVKLIR